MEEGPSTPEESTATKIIKSVLNSFEPKGSDPAFMPLQVGEKAISGDKGLETEDREGVQAGNKDKEVP